METHNLLDAQQIATFGTETIRHVVSDLPIPIGFMGLMYVVPTFTIKMNHLWRYTYESHGIRHGIFPGSWRSNHEQQTTPVLLDADLSWPHPSNMVSATKNGKAPFHFEIRLVADILEGTQKGIIWRNKFLYTVIQIVCTNEKINLKVPSCSGISHHIYQQFLSESIALSIHFCHFLQEYQEWIKMNEMTSKLGIILPSHLLSPIFHGWISQSTHHPDFFCHT